MLFWTVMLLPFFGAGVQNLGGLSMSIKLELVIVFLASFCPMLPSSGSVSICSAGDNGRIADMKSLQFMTPSRSLSSLLIMNLQVYSNTFP